MVATFDVQLSTRMKCGCWVLWPPPHLEKGCPMQQLTISNNVPGGIFQSQDPYPNASVSVHLSVLQFMRVLS